METEEKKELSRREFLIWAAVAASMLVLPARESHLAEAGEPADSEATSASTQALASLFNRSRNRAPETPPAPEPAPVATTVAVTAYETYDPYAPLLFPDPPPPIVYGPGDSIITSSSQTTYTVPSNRPPPSAQPAYAAPYQQTAVATAGYTTTYAQQPTVVAASYTQPAQHAVMTTSYVPTQPTVMTTAYVPPAYAAQPTYAAQPAAVVQQPSYSAPPRLSAVAQSVGPMHGGKLSAVSRRSWSVLAANTNKMRPMNGVTRITIHHEGSVKPNNDTTTVQVAATLRLIQGQHIKRMGAGDIGYHFIIDRTGTIWQGRDWRYQGAHTAGANANNLGVMLLGNFEIQQPTQQQLSSLHTLVAALVRMNRLNPRADIFAHDDFCKTHCPGRYLKPQVAILRNL